MQNFKKNKILCEKENFSKELLEKRKRKDLTLKKIAEEIKIDHKYLKLIEEGRYEKLPEGLYVRKFIREYAAYLGVDCKYILGKLKTKKINNNEKEKDFFSNQIVKKYKLLIFPKIIKSLIIVAAVSVCFVYLGFYLGGIMSVPYLEVIYPTDNLIVKNDFLKVVGKSNKETEVVINGDLVLLDENSFFSKEINLKKGVNVVSVMAKNKYGKEVRINRQIFVLE